MFFPTKTVEIRWNWRCKIFNLKIWRCKFLDKFHVWPRREDMNREGGSCFWDRRNWKPRSFLLPGISRSSPPKLSLGASWPGFHQRCHTSNCPWSMWCFGWQPHAQTNLNVGEGEAGTLLDANPLQAWEGERDCWEANYVGNESIECVRRLKLDLGMQFRNE